MCCCCCYCVVGASRDRFDPVLAVKLAIDFMRASRKTAAHPWVVGCGGVNETPSLTEIYIYPWTVVSSGGKHRPLYELLLYTNITKAGRVNRSDERGRRIRAKRNPLQGSFYLSACQIRAKFMISEVKTMKVGGFRGLVKLASARTFNFSNWITTSLQRALPFIQVANRMLERFGSIVAVCIFDFLSEAKSKQQAKYFTKNEADVERESEASARSFVLQLKQTHRFLVERNWFSSGKLWSVSSSKTRMVTGEQSRQQLHMEPEVGCGFDCRQHFAVRTQLKTWQYVMIQLLASKTNQKLKLLIVLSSLRNENRRLCVTWYVS